MMRTYEWSNDTTDDKGNNVCPSRQGNVVLQDDNEAKGEATDKNDHVPPPRGLLVVLDHVLVVAIVEDALACALVGCDNVCTHEENDVRNECANLELILDSASETRVEYTYGGVSHEQRVSECSCQSRKTVLSKSSLTKDTAHKELRGRVCATIGGAKLGGHEGERLGAPGITVVDRQHDDVADTETNGLVVLETQRKRRLERCNLY